MVATVTKFNQFKRQELNALADYLTNLDTSYRQQLETINKAVRTAFELKYEFGRAIDTNYDLIISECGTQKAFAEAIGQTEAQISNALRGYRSLKENGADSLDKALRILSERQIRPTSQNFDKIGSLLNNPTEFTTQTEQIPKDQQRLMDLHEEFDEIMRRQMHEESPLYKEALESM
jgi:transcriptional regulator with XRE-family HTH domain